MTNEEVMQLMTDMGLHEGGMDDWVFDNAWVMFANAVASAEREACAKIADYKLDNKGFTAPDSPKEWWNHACKNISDAIRSRGQA